MVWKKCPEMPQDGAEILSLADVKRIYESSTEKPKPRVMTEDAGLFGVKIALEDEGDVENVLTAVLTRQLCRLFLCWHQHIILQEAKV